MRPLLLRGKVWSGGATLDADAVLVRGNRIVQVGSAPALLRDAPDAEVLDAGLILPGICDSHAHPLSLGRSLVQVRLDGASSLDDVVTRATAWAIANPAGWVLGRGWDETGWNQADLEHAADRLDAVFPSRPVFLTRVDGHAALANTAAFNACGLDAAVPDPSGGRFARARGALSGLVVDAAMDRLVAAQPPVHRRDREAWLVASGRHCLAHGLTSVHDASVDPDTDAAYVSLAASGQLALRTYAMADLLHPDGLRLVDAGTRRERNLYEMRAIKLFSDGALGSRGAHLFAPYDDDPGNTGLAVQDDATLLRLATAATNAGFQICVHAIGDRANARVLDLLERVPGDRPRIEHAQIVRPSDVPRFSARGVIAAMQPSHATSDWRFAEARLGARRLAGAYAWRMMWDNGVPLAFGSDFPIEPADWLMGMHAATTRTNREGLPAGGWRPEECVTVDEALRAFTEGAAFACFREHELGRIEPGYLADLTLLKGDPLQTGDWLGAGILGTVVDGLLRV